MKVPDAGRCHGSDNLFSTDHYRIILITDRLIRLEGAMTPMNPLRITPQVIVGRTAHHVTSTIDHTGQDIVIQNSYYGLHFDGGPSRPRACMPRSRTSTITTQYGIGVTTRYCTIPSLHRRTSGEPRAPSTASTAVGYGAGIFSTQGWVMPDDSHLDQHGSTPRARPAPALTLLPCRRKPI